MNPRASPRPEFRPKGRGIRSMLMQDNSIYKFQSTPFLKLVSHYPPLVAGLFDLQISIHFVFEI
jgi:hypothetical protein